MLRWRFRGGKKGEVEEEGPRLSSPIINITSPRLTATGLAKEREEGMNDDDDSSMTQRGEASLLLASRSAFSLSRPCRELGDLSLPAFLAVSVV